jgi:hypothetical protein
MLQREGASFKISKRAPKPPFMHLTPDYTEPLGRLFVEQHGDLLDAADRDAVARAEAAYVELNAQLMEIHSQDIAAAWTKSVEAGETTASLDDYRQARGMRSKAIRRKMSALVDDLLPIQKRASKRIAEFAGELAVDYQARESGHLVPFGFSYQPSRLVELLHYTKSHSDQLVNTTLGISPAKALAWTGYKLEA